MKLRMLNSELFKFEKWPHPVRPKTKMYFHGSLGFHGQFEINSFLFFSNFQLFVGLFEKEHESMEVLAQLEIKKMLLDRLVNLLSRGYVIPVVKYIKACWDQTDTDISLIRSVKLSNSRDNSFCGKSNFIFKCTDVYNHDSFINLGQDLLKADMDCLK